MRVHVALFPICCFSFCPVGSLGPLFLFIPHSVVFIVFLRHQFDAAFTKTVNSRDSGPTMDSSSCPDLMSMELGSLMLPDFYFCYFNNLRFTSAEELVQETSSAFTAWTSPPEVNEEKMTSASVLSPSLPLSGLFYTRWHHRLPDFYHPSSSLARFPSADAPLCSCGITEDVCGGGGGARKDGWRVVFWTVTWPQDLRCGLSAS